MKYTEQELLDALTKFCGRFDFLQITHPHLAHKWTEQEQDEFNTIRACITDAFRFRVEIEGWREQLEKIATTWDVAQEMAIDKLRRSLANENDGAIVQRKNPESESPEIAGSTPASPMTLGEK